MPWRSWQKFVKSKRNKFFGKILGINKNYMQKTFYLLAIAGLLIFSCSGKKGDSLSAEGAQEKVQKNLIVYGSSDCHVCIDFKKKLDSANIEYEFRDFLITEKRYDEEMLNKLNAVGYRGNVQFPVVDIEGRMMVKPGFEYVLNALY